MKIDASDLISLLAFLVAGLSALYARWSWVEAKRSNNISFLDYRIGIYNAFLELNAHMDQKGVFAELKEVYKFHYPARDAFIYLPSELADSIKKYYLACFWIAEINEKNGGLTKEGSEEAKPYRQQEKDLAHHIKNAMHNLLTVDQA